MYRTIDNRQKRCIFSLTSALTPANLELFPVDEFPNPPPDDEFDSSDTFLACRRSLLSASAVVVVEEVVFPPNHEKGIMMVYEVWYWILEGAMDDMGWDAVDELS